jgi:hypothetical protein
MAIPVPYSSVSFWPVISTTWAPKVYLAQLRACLCFQMASADCDEKRQVVPRPLAAQNFQTFPIHKIICWMDQDVGVFLCGSCWIEDAGNTRRCGRAGGYGGPCQLLVRGADDAAMHILLWASPFLLFFPTAVTVLASLSTAPIPARKTSLGTCHPVKATFAQPSWAVWPNVLVHRIRGWD